MKTSRLLLLALVLAGPLLAQDSLSKQPSETPGSTLDLSQPSSDAAQLRRQAYALHQKAAQGDKQAAAQLAAWKRQGIGDVRLYVNVAAMEKLCAERDDPELVGQLGMAILDGKGGVVRDVPRGLALMEQACAKGSVSATLNLGLIYLNGLQAPDLPVDAAKARRYFEKLIERGDPRGHFELGYVASNLDKDHLAAAAHFERAGESGLSEGWRMAGLSLLASGAPIGERRRGVALLERAAALGDTRAAWRLGVIYWTGTDLAERDLAKATSFLLPVIQSAPSPGHERWLLDLVDGPTREKSKEASTPEQSAAARAGQSIREENLRELTRRRASDPKVDRFLTQLDNLRRTHAANSR
jgi:TPR repeat protein